MSVDEIRLLVEELYDALDHEPYHVFLGIDEHAEGDALRAGFHGRAAMLHPDTFYAHGDDALKHKVYEVYKRVTEAYRVLGDPAQRRAYEEQRRRGAHRLDVTERPQPAPTVNAAAKKYYLLALDAERRGDTKGALLNARLAVQMDPASEALQAMIKRLGS